MGFRLGQSEVCIQVWEDRRKAPAASAVGVLSEVITLPAAELAEASH